MYCTRIFPLLFLCLDPNLEAYFGGLSRVVKVISNSMLVTIDDHSSLPPHDDFLDRRHYIADLFLISNRSFYLDAYLDSPRPRVRNSDR